MPVAYAAPYAAMLAFAPPAAAGAVPVEPSDFQLRPAPSGGRITPERCPDPRSGEIVVCGRRGPGNRLAPLVPPPGVHPDQPLGIDLGGGARAEPHVSEVAMPNGQVSKRITIDFKIPF